MPTFEFLGGVFTIDFQHILSPMPITQEVLSARPPSTPSSGTLKRKRMNFSKPLPALPSEAHPTIRTVLQDKRDNGSLCWTDRRPSEISCPSMMTDSFSSTSDVGLEDYGDYTSPDGWDSYWSTVQDSSRPPSCYLDVAIRPQLRSQLSHENRNFASSDLSKLNPHSSTENLYMSAINCSTPSLPEPRKKRSQTLSPFLPPPIPSTPLAWPGDTEKSLHLARPRAYTTPSQASNKTWPPSNLSTCTTLNSQTSSTESSPLYMKCPPPSPLITPALSVLPPFDLDSEVSYFDDDDEEESARTKLVKVFRRRGSSNTGGEATLEKEPLPVRPKGRFRKRVSDANQTLKGVFGIKK